MAVRKIRWFRVYDDLVDDPKVQRLSCEHFRALVNLWCLASANGGTLPDREHIGFKLRLAPQQVDRVLDSLQAAGLLDREGDELAPHNWRERQFKSDQDPTAAERAKRHRDAKRNVTRDAPVASRPPESETDTDTEKEEDSAPGGAAPTGKAYAFDDGTIRLTEKDFDLWRRSFSALDVPAELVALSHWAETEFGPQKWFHPVKNALAKKNREEIARRKAAREPQEFKWRSGIEGVV